MKPFVPKRNSGTSFYRTYEGLKLIALAAVNLLNLSSFYRTYEGLKLKISRYCKSSRKFLSYL